MDTWSPITAQELQSLIDAQLGECSPEQRTIFERYRVPLRPVPLERYGHLESVFVVAQRGGEVMYYEDVEDGFNFSHLTSEGLVAEHWCNQDELKYAVIRWQDGGSQQNSALIRGPAQPLP
jgi:hypothetical protein